MWNVRIEDLSGGQLSRIALGKILLEEPELLILDEPTNHLDLNSIEWLEKTLIDYKGSYYNYFILNIFWIMFAIEFFELRQNN